MSKQTPFDPNIEVGELTIVPSTSRRYRPSAHDRLTAWACGLAPYQTANDRPDKSRVLAVSPQSSIQVRVDQDGSLANACGVL